MRARRVKITEEELAEAWDASRVDSGPWTVSLTFPYRGRSQRAIWRYDPHRREVFRRMIDASDAITGFESQIYRTIPHDMMRALPRLSVPAMFIGGAQSDVVRRLRLAGMKPKFRMRKVAGGHLFPFEHPQAAARSIVQALEELSAAPRAA